MSIKCKRIKRILVGDCDKEFSSKPPINRFRVLAAASWACFLSASLESDNKRGPWLWAVITTNLNIFRRTAQLMHLALYIEDWFLLKHVKSMFIFGFLFITPSEETFLAWFRFYLDKTSWNRFTLFISLAPNTLIQLGSSVCATHVLVCWRVIGSNCKSDL